MEYYINNTKNFSYIANQTDIYEKPNPLAELNAEYALALLPFTVVLGIFGVTGILGNILVFVIYGCGKKAKDQKYRVYVLNLAIIDFVTCLTLIPAEMWKHQSYFDFKETALCKMKCFFNVFAAASASFCLCIVALDRYIMTCHPFLFVKVRAFSHIVAWRLCGLMIFLGLLTAIPAAVMCGTDERTMMNSNDDNFKADDIEADKDNIDEDDLDVEEEVTSEDGDGEDADEVDDDNDDGEVYDEDNDLDNLEEDEGEEVSNLKLLQRQSDVLADEKCNEGAEEEEKLENTEEDTSFNQIEDDIARGTKRKHDDEVEE